MNSEFLTLLVVVIVNLLGLGALWGKIRQEVTILAEKHLELRECMRKEVADLTQGYRSGLTRVDERVKSLESKVFDSRGKAQFVDITDLNRLERTLSNTANETRELTKNLVTGLTDTIKQYYEVANKERMEQRVKLQEFEKRLLVSEQFCAHQHRDRDSK